MCPQTLDLAPPQSGARALLNQRNGEADDGVSCMGTRHSCRGRVPSTSCLRGLMDNRGKRASDGMWVRIQLLYSGS